MAVHHETSIDSGELALTEGQVAALGRAFAGVFPVRVLSVDNYQALPAGRQESFLQVVSAPEAKLTLDKLRKACRQPMVTMPHVLMLLHTGALLPARNDRVISEHAPIVFSCYVSVRPGETALHALTLRRVEEP